MKMQKVIIGDKILKTQTQQHKIEYNYHLWDLHIYNVRVCLFVRIRFLYLTKIENSKKRDEE